MEAHHDAAVDRYALADMTGVKGFNKDDVSVAMECKHDVAVARVGADGKPAHLISISFTDGLDNHVDFVRCCGGDIAGEWGH